MNANRATWAAIFWVTFLVNGAIAAEAENAPVKRASYELFFTECEEFDEIRQRTRDREVILADIVNTSLPADKRVAAIVELGLKSTPEEVPWQTLLAVAERLDVPEIVEVWAVVAAGKALCCAPRPRDLERWLFRQLRDGQHATAACVVLGVSRVAPHATLREWSRLLRDPATPDATCICIGKYSYLWGEVYDGGTLDEGVNCLLAGYDDSASAKRKLLIWETLWLIPDAAYRGHIEDTTLWALHELALREFANENNPAELRVKALTGLRGGELISQVAVFIAQKIQDEKKVGTDRLQEAAAHVLRNARAYGIAK